VDEELFVVAESVEGIEDGKVFRFFGVESGRENDAVGDVARKNLARDRVAFDAAGGGEDGEVNEAEEGKEVKEKTEMGGVRS
jgi:hypothetical protein